MDCFSTSQSKLTCVGPPAQLCADGAAPPSALRSRGPASFRPSRRFPVSSPARTADSDKISPNLLSERLQFYDFVSGVTDENREKPRRSRLSTECNRCVTNDDVHIHDSFGSVRCLAMGHLITPCKSLVFHGSNSIHKQLARQNAIRMFVIRGFWEG